MFQFVIFCILMSLPCVYGADGRTGLLEDVERVAPLSKENRDRFLAYGATLIPEYLESQGKDPRYYDRWSADLASVRHMINSRTKDLRRNPKLLERIITDLHDLIDLTYHAMEQEYKSAVTSGCTMGAFASAREISESYLASRMRNTVYYDALIDQAIRKLMELEIIQSDKPQGLFEVEWKGQEGQLWYRNIRGSYQVIPVSPESKSFYQTFFNESRDSLQPSLIFSEGRVIPNSGFVLRSLPERDEYVRLQRFYGADAPEDKRFTVFTKALYVPTALPMAQLLLEFMGEDSPMFLALPQTRREVLTLENLVLRLLIEDITSAALPDESESSPAGGGGTAEVVHAAAALAPESLGGAATEGAGMVLETLSEPLPELDNLERLRAQFKVYKLNPDVSVSTTTRGSHLTFHDSLGALTVARPHGTDDVHLGIARNAIRRAFASLYEMIRRTAKV